MRSRADKGVTFEPEMENSYVFIMMERGAAASNVIVLLIYSDLVAGFREPGSCGDASGTSALLRSVEQLKMTGELAYDNCRSLSRFDLHFSRLEEVEGG